MFTLESSYSEHSTAVAAKANRLTGAIHHIFGLKSCNLMWSTFQIYVVTLLMPDSTDKGLLCVKQVTLCTLSVKTMYLQYCVQVLSLINTL